ncbi:ParA family protein [Spartinivicinus poritis]|uniref:ParA family protein n=1 Tax=Spartinivicinus poritis TaxID=2994640 RepID=A0ABT5UJ46_9GAMM|nr:ParA family protein [Spartinivicinus sp. A2-2]MDE1465976.1 ParA family protein [Spartinivicinus sp. A2-2]
MKIITSATHKGGEAKTTFAQVTASYTAQVKNKRTLLIDLDKQSSLSRRYLRMESEETRAEIDGTAIPPVHPDYREGSDPSDFPPRTSFHGIYHGQMVVPYPTSIPNLDIVPSWSSRLDAVLKNSPDYLLERVYNRPLEFFKLPELRSAYDVVIIDTPPDKNPLVIGALRASTHVFIPVQLAQMSLEGLEAMKIFVGQQNDVVCHDHEIKLAGIVPTIYDKSASQKKRLEFLKDQHGDLIIDPPMYKRVTITRLSETPAEPSSFLEWPSSIMAKKYGHKKSQQENDKHELLETCEEVYKRVFK